MMILRKMRKNPNAKTTDKSKQHMVTITEDPNQIHNATVSKYKSLNYSKQKKQEKDANTFNRCGVIQDEEEVDEF